MGRSLPPSPPLVWTKSKRAAPFFRETFSFTDQPNVKWTFFHYVVFFAIFALRTMAFLYFDNFSFQKIACSVKKSGAV